MKTMKIKIINCSISLLVICCLSCKNDITNKDNKMKAYSIKEYSKAKDMFPVKFISQFPDSIGSELYTLSTSYSPELGQVYFFLYDYDNSIEEIDSISKELSNNSIAKYSASDPQLLVINENDTSKVFSKSFSNESITDFYYPVPFFYNLKNVNEHKLTQLDDSYIIYVLESDTTDNFNFKISQNESVKHKWKNGFSIGISLSEKKKTIIYWSFAW